LAPSSVGACPHIFGKGAGPGPEAIAAVILDEADLDVPDMAGEAPELHPGDTRLPPADDAHPALGFSAAKRAPPQHLRLHEFHELAVGGVELLITGRKALPKCLLSKLAIHGEALFRMMAHSSVRSSNEPMTNPAASSRAR
jgi:hypothetical protein